MWPTSLLELAVPSAFTDECIPHLPRGLQKLDAHRAIALTACGINNNLPPLSTVILPFMRESLDLPETLTVCLMLKKGAWFIQYLKDAESASKPEHENHYWHSACAFHDSGKELPYYFDMIPYKNRNRTFQEVQVEGDVSL